MSDVPRTRRLARKVLLIGWDAADWKVINPMIDAGLMPTLEGFINEGVMGNIATLDPPLSPMLWTSIATGKTADKHGILNFTQPDAEGKGIRPALSTTRKVKAIWNILTQEGFKTHVVGWWPSHPAEPINGVSVSNFYQRAMAPIDKPWPMPPGTVHPERLTEVMKELRVHPGELTAAHLLPFVPKAAGVDQEKDKRLMQVANILAHTATIQAAATWIMEHEPWDFMAVYFDAIDHFGHGFMRLRPPRLPNVPEDLFNLYNGVVTAGYRFHDMLLERLLQLAGPDTTVILMSDHGFHSDHLRPLGIPKEPAGPAIEHRALGIFCMKGPHVRKDEIVYGASLLDVTPTLLTLFGLPIGRDMDGKPLVTAFDYPVKPSFINSWEDVPGAAGMHPDDVRKDPWAEQAALQQLIELGYIEPPGEDQQKAIEKTTRESQYYLARVHLYAGRLEKALPILEEIHEQDPEAHRYAVRLAQCYQDLNRPDDCRRVIDSILEKRDPEKPMPTLDRLMGSLLLAEDKTEEALEHLLKAEQAEPRLPTLHIKLGQAYLSLKRYEDAERAFEKAVDVDPDSAVAHHGRGLTYLRQKRYRDAAEACLQAVGLRYFYPRAHYHLGEALMYLQYYERAAEAFEVAVTQAPGIRRAHLWLAELYRTRLNEPQKASDHLKFATERIRDVGARG